MTTTMTTTDVTTTAVRTARFGDHETVTVTEDAIWSFPEGMLVLSRRPGQSILIGRDIEIVVLGSDGVQVRVGIRAPREVTVLRRELFKQVEDENRRAMTAGLGAALGQLGGQSLGAPGLGAPGLGKPGVGKPGLGRPALAPHGASEHTSATPLPPEGVVATPAPMSPIARTA